MQAFIRVENKRFEEEAPVFRRTFELGRGHFTGISSQRREKPAAPCKSLMETLAGTEVEEDPSSMLQTWLESAEHLTKQTNKITSNKKPRAMEQKKISNSGRNRNKNNTSVLTVTPDPLLCVFFSFLLLLPTRDWSSYRVFCRKSIVPRRTSDECFLSSAHPK